MEIEEKPSFAVQEGEYVPKLKVRKSKIDYSTYKFYNKDKPFRILRFLHRAVANVFLRAHLKAAYRVKVIGKDKVRAIRKKGAVIISNHIHCLDIQMIAVMLFGMRPVNWLTLQRNMDLSVAFFIRNSGGVPIPEEHDQKKRCFCEMNDWLADGGLLHICPEGSLVELCDDIRPFKDGAFRFALQNKVPLVPVTLRFDEYSPKGKKYRHPHFTIDVGDLIYPIYTQEVMKERAREDMLKRCTKNYGGSSAAHSTPE